MTLMQLGDLQLDAGQSGNGSMGSIELADGSLIKIPLKIVRGRQPGPNLVVLAAVHGTEVSGVAALLDVFTAVDPDSLAGALIGVTVANPLSFQIGTYVTPHDHLNLAGPWIFPDVPGGTQTAMLGAAIQPALEAADLVVDLHANPLPSMPFVMVDTEENLPSSDVREAVHRMAEAFGVTAIEVPYPSGRPPTIRPRCTMQGIPALTVELAGNMQITQEACRVGTTGLLNIMKAFGMLPGPPDPQPVQKLTGRYRYMGRLRASRGGLMRIRKRPGERIEQGETVIDIINVYGDIVEAITMPAPGYCWSFTGGVGGTHAITAGDNLAYTFEELG
jgi:uncharacterized protein